MCFVSLYSQYPLLLFSFYCTKSTQARPDHTPDAFHERKTKSKEDASVDISPPNVKSDVVGSAPKLESKPEEPKAKADVGVLPEMRSTHVKGFLHRGLQEATCPEECSGGCVVCENGYTADGVSCREACVPFGCCRGLDSCSGFTGTLCTDTSFAPSCSGQFACYNANIGLAIEGCTGDEACREADIRMVYQGCNNAQRACSYASIDKVIRGCSAGVACSRADIGSVSYACNAPGACFNADIPTANIENCCNERTVCQDATEETLQLECRCPGGYVVCENGFTADGVTCADACGGQCCRGAYYQQSRGPCTGFTGRICKDANRPPCSGQVACNGANIGLVVQGCNSAGYTCLNANIGSVVQGCSGGFAACRDANIDVVFQGCRQSYSCFSANIESVDQGCNAFQACDSANIPQYDIVDCCNTRRECLQITSLPAECTPPAPLPPAPLPPAPGPPAPGPVAPAGPEPTAEPTLAPVAKSIEAECPCSSEWKSHGKYVKCVDKAVKALDIPKSEKKSFKKRAARSDCGKNTKKATLQLVAASAKEQPNNSGHTLAAVSAWAIVPVFMWWFLQMENDHHILPFQGMDACICSRKHTPRKRDLGYV